MLHVTDTGSGAPILWLHGFPLASSIFEKQLAIRGVRHLMPDFPGFGQSDPPLHEPEMDDYARLAIDVLHHRSIEKAIVAGLSMGGYVAFALARLAPEKVGGLILIDTRETPDTDEARQGRIDTMKKVGEQGPHVVIDSMLPKMLTSGAPQEMKNRVREIMTSSSQEGVIAALRAIAHRPDSTKDLPRLDVPALVIVGEEDGITPPADAERMAGALRHATLVKIPNAAHLSNYEQAETFNAAVQDWLRSTIGNAR
jgi:3-oxoadipate enol-lactonase